MGEAGLGSGRKAGQSLNSGQVPHSKRADLPDTTGEVWSESHLTAVHIQGEENGFSYAHICLSLATGYLRRK